MRIGSVLLLSLLAAGCDAPRPAARQAPGEMVRPATRDSGVWPDTARAALVRMGAEDQAARERLVALIQEGASVDSAAARRAVAAQDSVDHGNTERLKELVASFGWPGKPAAGDSAAGAAFLIVQHATHDPAFQKRYLSWLTGEHAAGRASGESVALLTDRTRQADGELQLYGTQLRLEDGRLVLDPIEDADHVDERRAALGLPPLADYVRMVREMYGVPYGADADSAGGAP